MISNRKTQNPAMLEERQRSTIVLIQPQDTQSPNVKGMFNSEKKLENLNNVSSWTPWPMSKKNMPLQSCSVHLKRVFAMSLAATLGRVAQTGIYDEHTFPEIFKKLLDEEILTVAPTCTDIADAQCQEICRGEHWSNYPRFMNSYRPLPCPGRCSRQKGHDDETIFHLCILCEIFAVLKNHRLEGFYQCGKVDDIGAYILKQRQNMWQKQAELNWVRSNSDQICTDEETDDTCPTHQPTEGPTTPASKRKRSNDTDFTPEQIAYMERNRRAALQKHEQRAMQRQQAYFQGVPPTHQQ